MKMSWFFIIFFLSFTVCDLEAVPDQQQLPSAASAFVVGTVYCDTCFQKHFSKSSFFISGASVAVECRDGGDSKPSFRQEVKTDENGEFRIPLPFSVAKQVKKIIRRCSVKLVKSSEPNCAEVSTATSSALHLKSRSEGSQIFSAGFFTFKPLKQPKLCNQKPGLQEDSREFKFKKVASTRPDLPAIPLLPKLPPLPRLPPLPPLPWLPYLPPMPEQLSRAAQLSGQKVSHPRFFFFPTTPLPPNPFLPPQNPLQPPPLFPPNPLEPPPGCEANPSLIPPPPVPGLTLPPLPPFPFLFPPLPPRIPGILQAPSSPKKKKPSPGLNPNLT